MTSFADDVHRYIPDIATISADARQRAMGLSYVKEDPALLSSCLARFAAEHRMLRDVSMDPRFERDLNIALNDFLRKKYVVRRSKGFEILEAELADLAREVSTFVLGRTVLQRVEDDRRPRN